MIWVKHILCDKTWSIMLSVIISVIIMYTAQDSFIGENKFDVVTVIITIVTITVGFATAALTMFLGITDKPVIERIRKRNYIETLVNSFKDLIYFGGLVILLSIIISIYGVSSVDFAILGITFNLNNILIALFIFCTCSSLIYAFYLVRLILLIFKYILIEPNSNKEHS